jgi:peptide/nickel transport system substrate-binding protein
MRWLALMSAALFLVCVSCDDEPTDPSGSPVETAPVVAPSAEVATGPTTEPLLDPGAGPGVLVWVHDREPPDLHVDDPANATDLAAWIQEGLVEGLFGVDSKLAYYPELLAGEPQVTKQDSGAVVVAYQLRDNLAWSDGTALTAADVAYTNRVILEGCEVESDGSIIDSTNDGCEYLMSSRIGYELITDFEVTSPTTFTVTFAAFFAGWRGLYPHVMAEHAFGVDAFTVNQNLRLWAAGSATLPSSGPLLFQGWEPGHHIDLARNDHYHGSVSPEALNRGPAVVEGVRIVFVGDLEARMELLRQGKAHLIMASLDPTLASLTQAEGFVVASRPGGVFEHVGLNLLNPHLAKPQVREAIAYAIDKAEIVSQIYQPILGSSLPEQGLGNTYWVTTQAAYEDHQAGFAGNNIAAAETALISAGYAQGPDGVWAHPEAGRLSLRAGTTAGNKLREAELDLVRVQLARAGIEVVITSFPGGLFFDQGPFSPSALEASATGGTSGDPNLWDVALFSWATGPWPGGVTGIYAKGSDSNPYGFYNPEFDAAAAECETMVADEERALCYNDLDTFVTTLDHGDNGLFMIPLTQRPRYFGYFSGLLASAGVAPDLAQGGPLVNVADYELTS